MRKLVLHIVIVLLTINVYAQDLNWGINLGNVGLSDQGAGIALDASGNIYTIGRFQGTADFDPGAGTSNLTSNGNYDIYVAKYNSSGVYQWAFSIGGTDIDYGADIAIDAASNIYITGNFRNTVDFNPDAGTNNLTSSGNDDAFIAKYNSSGVYQWAFQLGSTSLERGSSIAIDAASNVYVTGSFSNTVDFNPGAGTNNLTTSIGVNNVFVAKYNSSGTYQWAFQIGGSSGSAGYGIALDAASNVYIIGQFYSTADFNPGAGTNNLTPIGFLDVFVAKYTSSGAYVWAFNLGGTVVSGNNIAVDASSNVYITGSFTGNPVDFNPGAGTNTLTSNGGNDVYIAKYTSSGVYDWAFQLGGTGNNDYGLGIAVDVAANVYVTGRFENTIDFNPDAGVTHNLTSNGNTDVYIAKYNSSGVYDGAFNIGGVNNDYGHGIVADGSGEAYITGYFAGSSIDFDPDSGTTTNLSTSSNTDVDVFIATYKESALPVELTYFKGEKKDKDVLLLWQTEGSENNLGFEIERSSDGRDWKTIGFVQGGNILQATHDYMFIDEQSLVGRTNYYRLKQIDLDGAFEYSELVVIRMEGDAQSFDIFPNPITDELMIMNGQGQATIYNLFGQPVRQFVVDQEQYMIQTTDLEKGQYILHLQNENGIRQTKRFVKLDSK